MLVSDPAVRTRHGPTRDLAGLGHGDEVAPAPVGVVRRPQLGATRGLALGIHPVENPLIHQSRVGGTPAVDTHARDAGRIVDRRFADRDHAFRLTAAHV